MSVRNDSLVSSTGGDVLCHTAHTSTAGRDPPSAKKGKARVTFYVDK